MHGAALRASSDAAPASCRRRFTPPAKGRGANPWRPAPRPEIYVTFRIKTPREVPFFNPAARFSRIPSDSGEPSYLWVALHSSEFGKKRGSLYFFTWKSRMIV